MLCMLLTNRLGELSPDGDELLTCGCNCVAVLIAPENEASHGPCSQLAGAGPVPAHTVPSLLGNGLKPNKITLNRDRQE